MNSHVPSWKMGLNSMLPVVNRQHVPAHSAALLVLTRSALHQQGSPVVTQRARIVPSATTSMAYILCFGQVDLSIWVFIDQHTTSATRMNRPMTRILGDVTRTLD